MLKRIAAFTVLLGWCAALVALRMARADNFLFSFLIWNLFLAAVPFAASLLLEALDRHRRVRPLQWVSFAVWLLFLPNAPYIIRGEGYLTTILASSIHRSRTA